MEIKKEMIVMEVIQDIKKIYDDRCKIQFDTDETGALVSITKTYNYNQGEEFTKHKDKILYRCRRLSAKKNKMRLKHFIVNMEGVFFYVEDKNK